MITITGTRAAAADASPTITAAVITHLLSKAIEQLTLREFNQLSEALSSKPEGDAQSDVSVGDVLAPRNPYMRAPIHPIVVTGTKTVSRDISPAFTADLLTHLLSRAPEELTLKEFGQLTDALKMLPRGGSQEDTTTVGDLLT